MKTTILSKSSLIKRLGEYYKVNSFKKVYSEASKAFKITTIAPLFSDVDSTWTCVLFCKNKNKQMLSATGFDEEDCIVKCLARLKLGEFLMNKPENSIVLVDTIYYGNGDGKAINRWAERRYEKSISDSEKAKELIIASKNLSALPPYYEFHIAGTKGENHRKLKGFEVEDGLSWKEVETRLNQFVATN